MAALHRSDEPDNTGTPPTTTGEGSESAVKEKKQLGLAAFKVGEDSAFQADLQVPCYSSSQMSYY